jgi:predicted double-glycine peptidase
LPGCDPSFVARAGFQARGLVLLLLVIAMAAAPAAAAEVQNQKPAHALLDVPYVPQTPELCGGAAVAMVLRYWGERQVFPEDFSSLVIPSERGIPTGSLVAAVRDRKWLATVMSADPDDARSRIQTAIDRGRPLIALIEVSPRTFHYVVIAGATQKEIVVHDPARSPFRVLPWGDFDRAWAAAGRWMMLVLPPASGRPGATPERTGAPTVGGNAGGPAMTRKRPRRHWSVPRACARCMLVRGENWRGGDSRSPDGSTRGRSL